MKTKRNIQKKLLDEKLGEITDLDKKFDLDNLIYEYKGLTADEEFEKFKIG